MQFLLNSYLTKNLKFLFMFKLYKPVLPPIEIQITNHCNLCCNGCSHFSNISDKYELSTEEYRNTILNLVKNFKVQNLCLTGGEPLLHPQLTEFIKISREIEPNVTISIATNGLLIKSLTRDMLDFFIKNKVKFVVSKYPISSNLFTEICDILGDNDLLERIYVRNYFRKYINIKGDADIKKTHNICWLKNCLIIRDYKLFHCPFAAYVYIFNKKYGANISEESGIDIRTNSPKTIFKYLRKPIDTCRFCTFCNQESMAWSNKEAEYSHWILTR